MSENDPHNYPALTSAEQIGYENLLLRNRIERLEALKTPATSQLLNIIKAALDDAEKECAEQRTRIEELEKMLIERVDTNDARLDRIERLEAALRMSDDLIDRLKMGPMFAIATALASARIASSSTSRLSAASYFFLASACSAKR